MNQFSGVTFTIKSSDGFKTPLEAQIVTLFLSTLLSLETDFLGCNPLPFRRIRCVYCLIIYIPTVMEMLITRFYTHRYLHTLTTFGSFLRVIALICLFLHEYTIFVIYWSNYRSLLMCTAMLCVWIGTHCVNRSIILETFEYSQ